MVRNCTVEDVFRLQVGERTPAKRSTKARKAALPDVSQVKRYGVR